MKQLIAEWLWRGALLVALGWIGWELMLLHDDLNQPVDETTVTTAADETQDSLDELHDELGVLTRKVDAILVVMARTK